MVNHGIYKITCLNNRKVYIGSAIDLKSRISNHKNSLLKNIHKNSHLQAAYNLYGIQNFVFEIIEYVENKQNLLNREQYWMDTTKCYDKKIGFNICIKAGSSLGIKRSDEFKKKISLFNKNKTPEEKQKIIDAIKKANIGRVSPTKGIKTGKNPNNKTCKGMKFPNRKFTPEGYKKICESNRRPKPEGYFEMISAIRAKTYFFINPNGDMVTIINMKKYCEETGLNKSRMYQVAKGNEKQHKGWTIVPYIEPEFRNI